jgi:hypothetical protein
VVIAKDPLTAAPYAARKSASARGAEADGLKALSADRLDCVGRISRKQSRRSEQDLAASHRPSPVRQAEVRHLR